MKNKKHDIEINSHAFYSIRGVCQILDISRRTLERWRQNKKDFPRAYETTDKKGNLKVAGWFGWQIEQYLREHTSKK